MKESLSVLLLWPSTTALLLLLSPFILNTVGMITMQEKWKPNNSNQDTNYHHC